MKKLGYFLFAVGVLGFALYIFAGQGTVLFRDTDTVDKPLRLHVLAASDDLYDQQLKLDLRDFVIGYLETDLENSQSKQQAMAAIEEALPRIEVACNDFIVGKADYSVKVELTKSDFPEIDYNGMVFAAGEYDALRIVLGEGRGHNWWCVLFPPLCFVDLAGEYEEETVSAVAGMDNSKAANTLMVKWKISQLWKDND